MFSKGFKLLPFGRLILTRYFSKNHKVLQKQQADMEQEECFALPFPYSSSLRNVPMDSPQIPSVLQALPGMPTCPMFTGTLLAREGGSRTLSSTALQAGGQRGLTALWAVLLIVKTHQAVVLQGDTSCQNVRLQLHQYANP